MNQKKPEYLRPALIGGAIAGVLSGLPIVSAGNCFCCLWIIGGAALAVSLLAKNTAGVLTSGDGAIVGALSGITAAVVDSLMAIPLRSFNIELARRVVDRVSDFGYEMPSNLDGLLDGGSAFLTPGWFLPVRAEKKPDGAARVTSSGDRRCNLKPRSSSTPSRTRAGPASAGGKSATG
jgi:hypothetical protein